MRSRWSVHFFAREYATVPSFGSWTGAALTDPQHQHSPGAARPATTQAAFQVRALSPLAQPNGSLLTCMAGSDGGGGAAWPRNCLAPAANALPGCSSRQSASPPDCQAMTGRRGRKQQQPGAAGPVPWATLPSELVVAILGHLTLEER